MGDLYLDLRQFSEADSAYWESHRIREELWNQNKKDPERAFQLARGWENFGRYQSRNSSVATALWFFNKTREMREELCRKQPDNREYASDLIDVLNRMAELKLLSNNALGSKEVADISALLSRSQELVKEVLADNPGRQNELATLAEIHVLKARLLLHDPKPDATRQQAATAALRDARDILLKQVKRKLTPNDHYTLAADFLLSQEFSALTPNGPNGPKSNGSTFTERARQQLTEAVKEKFSRLTADQVRNDRAFRSVAKEEWFKALLVHLKNGTTPQAAKKEQSE
jgi:hypothetical protein